jgi:hypothetical protein
MGLADIISTVDAELEAADVELTSLVGAHHLAAEGAPPRVVWVPTEDSFGPAEKGGVEPRQLRTRIAGVEAHVWGQDLAATEALVNSVIAAVHAAAHGSYAVSSGRWYGQDGEVLHFGTVCVLSFQFRIPVTAPTYETAVVETVTKTATLES